MSGTPDFQLIEIREVPLDELRPHPRNPRTITDVRMAALIRDLEGDPGMLAMRPLIALPDGTVVGGNMRLAAAKELGWETIPVAFADMDDATAALRAIRDNVPYGEWEDRLLGEQLREIVELAGEDALLLTGLEDGRIEELMVPVEPPAPTEPAEPPEPHVFECPKCGHRWTEK